MQKARFTRPLIRRIVQGSEDPGPWHDTDSPLRLKKNKHGASYSVRRWVNGKAVTYTPRNADGSVIENSAGILTLDQARDWAKALVGRLAEGLEPQPSKEPTRKITFSSIAQEYLAKYQDTHTPSSARAEQWGIRYADKVLGTLNPSQIDALAIERLKQAYADSPSNLRKAWGAAKRVLDQAVMQGLTQVNLFAVLPAPKAPKAKNRYPKLAELVAIWRACEQTRGVGADIVQFAIVMPLRASAITSLTWAEVDTDLSELNLRATPGRKFTQDQRLPLPSLAVELLQSRSRLSPVVFPGRGKAPFSAWSSTVNRLHKRSGVEGWSIHDFRRSAISITAELRPDVSLDSLDYWLSHAHSASVSGIAKVYQQAQGYARMKLAAEAWDQILRGSLAGNVIPIRRAS